MCRSVSEQVSVCVCLCSNIIAYHLPIRNSCSVAVAVELQVSTGEEKRGKAKIGSLLCIIGSLRLDAEMLRRAKEKLKVKLFTVFCVGVGEIQGKKRVREIREVMKGRE